MQVTKEEVLKIFFQLSSSLFGFLKKYISAVMFFGCFSKLRTCVFCSLHNKKKLSFFFSPENLLPWYRRLEKAKIIFLDTFSSMILKSTIYFDFIDEKRKIAWRNLHVDHSKFFFDSRNDESFSTFHEILYKYFFHSELRKME